MSILYNVNLILMISYFFNFGGYEIYILAAFLFAFVPCVYLYINTKRELVKYEDLFLVELEELKKKEATIIVKDKKIKKVYQLS